MAIKTVNLFGTWINNAAVFSEGTVVDLNNIKAYSLNNGIMEEYQLLESTEHSVFTISKGEKIIGTISHYTNPEKYTFSIGLLMDFQEIQLTVEIPYEDQHGL